MVFQLEPIKVQVVFDSTGFNRALAQASQGSQRFTKTVESQFRALDRTLKGITAAVAGVFTIQAARNFLRAGEAIEKIQISLRGLLGSAEAADKAFRAIESLAVDLPQGINELTEAFVNLETAGLGTIRNLESVSDVATVMNRSVVDVSLALRSLETETLRNAFGFQEVSTKAGEFYAITREGTKVQAKSRQEFREGILLYLQTSKFAGAARQATGTFGSSLETIGNTLAKTSSLVRQTLAPALDVLSRKFKEVGDRFETFLKSPSGQDPSKTNLQILQETFKEFTEEKVISGIKQVAKDIETIAKAINEMDASKLSKLSATAKVLGTVGGGAAATHTAFGAANLLGQVGLFALSRKGFSRVGRFQETLGIDPEASAFDEQVGSLTTPVRQAEAAATGLATKLKSLVGRAGTIALIATGVGFVVKSILEAVGVTIDWNKIWEGTKKVVGSVFDAIIKGVKTLGIAFQATAKGWELIIDSIVLGVAKGIQKFNELKREFLLTLGDIGRAINETKIGDFLVPDDVLFGPNGIEQRAADAGTAAAKAAGIVDNAFKELNEDSADVNALFDELVKVWGDIPDVAMAMGRETAGAAGAMNELSDSADGAGKAVGGASKSFEDAKDTLAALRQEVEDLRFENTIFDRTDLQKNLARIDKEFGDAVRDLTKENFAPEAVRQITSLLLERRTEEVEGALLESKRTVRETTQDLIDEIQSVEFETALTRVVDETDRRMLEAQRDFVNLMRDITELGVSPEDEASLQSLATQLLNSRVRQIKETTDNFVLEFGQDLDSAVAQGFSGGLSAALESGDWRDFFSTLGESVFNAIAENAAKALVQGLGFQGFFTNLFSGGGGGGEGGAGFLGGLLSSIGGLFGFASGGVVPQIPGSSPFRDSVPALLTPGERVLTRAENRAFEGALAGGTQSGPPVVFNIQTNDVQSFREYLQRERETISSIIAGDIQSNGRVRQVLRA